MMDPVNVWSVGQSLSLQSSCTATKQLNLWDVFWHKD